MKRFTPFIALVLSLNFLLLSCSKDATDLSNDQIEPTTSTTALILNEGADEVPRIDEVALAKDAAITPQEAMEDALFYRSPFIEIPAGSQDALEDALAQISSQGVIYLKAGDHFESGTITINKPVKIIGEPGAKLISPTRVDEVAGQIEPMIYIKDTRKVQIWGLDFQPQDGVGGTGVLVDNSPFTFVRHNQFDNLQYAILIENSNNCRVFGNSIATTGLWLSGEIFGAYGIVNINGVNNFIAYNKVSNSLFGIWACNKSGVLYKNRTFENFIGIILCNVPEMFPFLLPSGTGGFSKTPANKWFVSKNNAKHNFSTGYLVIDGANNNLLTNNAASDNGDYDYEITTDSHRFGFLTPAAFENILHAKDGQSVKNCGPDNHITGGDLVNIGADPCF